MTDTERTLTVTSQPRRPGLVVLRVAGELDHHTAPSLRQAIDEFPFDESGLILDVSDLLYCDSTGLTVFVLARHRAEAAGSVLAIAGLRDDLRRVFDITGLDQFFTLHPSTEQAVASVSE
ncbi:STAS domain-containing protein [Streptomyces sp. NPDC018610]|uniref:STAS domain-containing protein n=1 Tax=Streptomyces sp. NPDC018610 TaxID=3365049 RepID=UPI0037B25CF1